MKKFQISKLAALMPQPRPRKPKSTSLRVTASRLVPTGFDDEEEPTTKLSTAFVVVLALHLVAVGGIYAFHSIKSHRREADGTALTATAAEKKGAHGSASAGPLANKAQTGEKNAVHAAQGAVAMKSPSATTQSFAPTPAPVQVKAPAGVPAGGAVYKNTTPSAALPQAQTAGITPVDRAASGGRTPSASPVPPSAEGAARTYTVKRGDNPWSIAKSQGVSYDDLMKINGLQDPKKLQLNQILKLPPKKAVN